MTLYWTKIPKNERIEHVTATKDLEFRNTIIDDIVFEMRDSLDNEELMKYYLMTNNLALRSNIKMYMK